MIDANVEVGIVDGCLATVKLVPPTFVLSLSLAAREQLPGPMGPIVYMRYITPSGIKYIQNSGPVLSK